MGILSCLSALWMLIEPILAFVFIASTISIVIALIAVYGGFLWLKWLQNDDAETRKGAVLACALNIVACLISAVWTLVNLVFLIGGITISGLLFAVMFYIVWMLLSFYYYT